MPQQIGYTTPSFLSQRSRSSSSFPRERSNSRTYDVVPGSFGRANSHSSLYGSDADDTPLAREFKQKAAMNAQNNRRPSFQDVKKGTAASRTMARRRSIQDMLILLGKTRFTEDELEVFTEQFKQYSSTGDTRGTLDRINFNTAMSYFHDVTGGEASLDRIYRAFDEDNSGRIDYREFILGMSTYVKGTEDEKVAFMVKLYDTNNDGFISPEELRYMLRALFHCIHPDPIEDEYERNKVVERIIKKVKFGPVDKIPLQDFRKTISRVPELSRLLSSVYGS